MIEPVAEELDELTDDAALAQHLGDRQHEVRGRCAFGELALELEADDLRNQHRDRLAKHRGLGLDAADAPAQDAEAVDHRRVRVRADERVGIRETVLADLFLEHDAAQVLEVHLVHDAGVRRHDAEVLERVLAPAQEGVALLVALELDGRVLGEGVGRAEVIHLHRMVDDELGRRQRIDHLRLAAELDDGVAHRGEIDDGRHASEVLQNDARRRERDLAVGFGFRVPVGKRRDVGRGDVLAVLEAQEVLEQDFQRIGQRLDRAFDGLETVDLVVRGTDGELLASAETVGHWNL